MWSIHDALPVRNLELDEEQKPQQEISSSLICMPVQIFREAHCVSLIEYIYK